MIRRMPSGPASSPEFVLSLTPLNYKWLEKFDTVRVCLRGRAAMTTLRAFAAKPRCVATPRCALVCRAKIDMSAARAMTNDEIDLKVKELKTELLLMRFKQANREAFSTADKPKTQRDIARLLTAKREKEIKEFKISKRESRRLSRKALVESGMAI
jgi:ribosomal protein L29